MNPNAKTPVMVLQEFAVKKGLPSPEYSIIHARQGTHDNEFHYQVCTSGVRAVGVGRSKQIAKHNAATKALQLLEHNGLYKPDGTPIQTPDLKPSVGESIVNQLIINSISSLNEICMEHKLPFPEFRQVSEFGLQHCKEFTYECSMASNITRATAGTKKLAKHLAAKDMIERVMQVLPELVAECSNDPINAAALTDQDTNAIEQYVQLKDFKRPKPNLAIQLINYDKNLLNIMKEMNVASHELQQFFEGEKNEETLIELLKKLELEYIFEMLNQSPIVLALTINTDVPFSVIGSGDAMDIAKQTAVSKAFQHIKILLA